MSEIPSNLYYFESTFDPNKITVLNLRSILVTYHVRYPSAAKKAELVALFQEHILPLREQVLAQRAQVKPSSEGIIDGRNPGK
ncbi:hypothetical protein CONLIGDRAFT_586077 [Coniochaeta ligniaria NRRL 30616]|uniref:HeH/LEM domain-containing protein n=1 Tax=Coniochaeta ligniaria NRRL 30616 TaxID=1408157 RepID=A0A1J7I6T3_9PEZI|nr:hypothetical protein CONLIGDRAFT_586077 [Coniochaeta ligniaria NRRL 30616]